MFGSLSATPVVVVTVTGPPPLVPEAEAFTARVGEGVGAPVVYART